MKAKSRRRLLLSSVAMLLVAMLALGTATFAWFTTKADANANKINVKTTKSSFLQVAKADYAFADTVTYVGDTALKLKPASSVDGTDWYYGEAEKTSNYAIKDGANFTKLTDGIGHSGNGLYVYREMLNIKNAGTTAVSNVQIKISAESMDSTARLAVVPVTDPGKGEGDAGFTFPTVDADDFKANIYASTADITWDGVSGTAKTDVAAMPGTGNAVKAANNATINVTASNATLAAGHVVSYAVFVWFEGQDSNLYEQSSNGFTVPDISFNVTGTSAEGA